MKENFYQKVYKIVERIPKGKVATYGQVATLVGYPRAAQMVGWALHQLRGRKLEIIPWQRVINREGRISTTCLEHTADEQAYLLKSEGVEVKKIDDNYFVDLDKYLWRPNKNK